MCCGAVGYCYLTGWRKLTDRRVKEGYGAVRREFLTAQEPRTGKEATIQYGFSKTTDLSYEAAVEKVTEELRNEGFGVLTTIDVKETLKKKLDVDFKKYVILGACNPPFAHQALNAEEEIGLLLPCNVIVYEKEGKSVVAAFDPMIMTKVLDNPKVQPIADEAQKRLKRVIERM